MAGIPPNHGIMQRWQGKVLGALVWAKNLFVSKSITLQPQFLTAAGLTIGTATAVSSSGGALFIMATTTVSTHGVKLPAAVTGLTYIGQNSGTLNGLVYATGAKIEAASTGTGFVLAAAKGAVFTASSKTQWHVVKGA